MAKSKEGIILEIVDHMNRFKQPNTSWYVGITDKPKDRIFKQHGIDEDNQSVFYINAESEALAREVELYFTEELGTQGAPGGGDKDTTWVYAFLAY